MAASMSKFEPQGEDVNSREMEEVFEDAIVTRFGKHTGKSEHDKAGLNSKTVLEPNPKELTPKALSCNRMSNPEKCGIKSSKKFVELVVTFNKTALAASDREKPVL
jgi:hypothetical protein